MREYSFDRPLDKFHRTARTWFDGSVESVDRRLADCRRLLASSMAAVGSNWGSEASYAHIDRIASLQAQERVLTDQRSSLLTAGNDRTAGDYREKEWDEPGEDFGKTFTRKRGPISKEPKKDPFAQTSHEDPELSGHLGDFWRWNDEKHLSSKDQRYVELEATKFVANHPGVDRDELITRATHKAQVETSTFTPERSRAITAAFRQKVASLHRPAPRQRTAATTTPDCADEMLFVM